MRASFIAAGLAVAVAALPTIASAQMQRDPRVSPSEEMVQGINRSLQQSRRQLGQDQQLQFEINQLRQSQQRIQVTPQITGPGLSVGCAPGAPRC